MSIVRKLRALTLGCALGQNRHMRLTHHRGLPSTTRRCLAMALTLGLTALIVSPEVAQADPTPPNPIVGCATYMTSAGETRTSSTVRVTMTGGVICEESVFDISLIGRVGAVGTGGHWFAADHCPSACAAISRTFTSPDEPSTDNGIMVCYFGEMVGLPVNGSKGLATYPCRLV